MFSTSSLPEGFLESFARTYNPNTRIRVISADEDPCQFPLNLGVTPGLPPSLDTGNFPILGFEFDLFKLPAELREMVWEAYMYEDDTLNDWRREWIRWSVNAGTPPSKPNFITDLVKVSKNTRDEVTLIQMRNSRFMIASIRDNAYFRNFIASVQGGLRYVRELHFDNFDFFPDFDRSTGIRIPSSSDMELAVACPGLRILRLTMGR